MVIRIPIRLLSIIIGTVICISSVIPYPQTVIPSVSTSDSSKPILIIDAGHGGDDGGAVGINGVTESNINLAISLKLNSLCHLYGISTVMTRNQETISYPNDAKTIAERKKADQYMRLRLIQDYPDAILYSIHQNYYPSEIPSGIQVLYGHNQTSRELGVLLHGNLNQVLCPDNRRVATEISDNIFLLKECDCTAVLIECGFISNRNEVKLLQTEQYQQKLSAVLLSTYFQYTNSMKSE